MDASSPLLREIILVREVIDFASQEWLRSTLRRICEGSPKAREIVCEELMSKRLEETDDNGPQGQGGDGLQGQGDSSPQGQGGNGLQGQGDIGPKDAPVAISDNVAKYEIKPVTEAKRRQAHELVQCVQCQIFTFPFKNGPGACNWHFGEPRLNVEDRAWAIRNENKNGAHGIDNCHEVYPSRFTWTCCGKRGDGSGCKSTPHDFAPQIFVTKEEPRDD